MTPECNKCGTCCKSLQFVVEGLSNDRMLREYFKARGIPRNGDKLLVPHICPILTEDNLCKVWGTDRQPMICKRFRGQKGYYTPECCVFHKKNKEGENGSN